MALSQNQRIEAFSQLGRLLEEFSAKDFDAWPHAAERAELAVLRMAVKGSIELNPWFTNDSIKFAIRNLAKVLKADALAEWVSPYVGFSEPGMPKNIGVVMAGNIPAVGFHDFLCVLMSGNSFQGKTSSDDPLLLPAIAALLIEIEPGFKDLISFRSDRLEGFDAVIATGSNNSARYFDHFYGAYPHIIRRNRNGVAVLTGNETVEQLEKLSTDVFAYFGLGCRNVSYLLLNSDFDPDLLFRAFEPYRSAMLSHQKYMNNYTYNKALMKLGNEPFFDNGFVLLRKSATVASPMACLNYDIFDKHEDLENMLQPMIANEWVQCVVSEGAWLPGSVDFGHGQTPQLSDYADGIDTMKWLESITSY